MHRVIEQLIFLMFIERLDHLHTVEERKSENLTPPRPAAFSLQALTTQASPSTTCAGPTSSTSRPAR